MARQGILSILGQVPWPHPSQVQGAAWAWHVRLIPPPTGTQQGWSNAAAGLHFLAASAAAAPSSYHCQCIYYCQTRPRCPGTLSRLPHTHHWGPWMERAGRVSIEPSLVPARAGNARLDGRDGATGGWGAASGSMMGRQGQDHATRSQGSDSTS